MKFPDFFPEEHALRKKTKRITKKKDNFECFKPKVFSGDSYNRLKTKLF